MREQCHQIAQRIVNHWFGETTLWEAMTHCIALVVMPMCLGILIGIACGVLTRSESKIFNVAFHAGIGVTLAGVGWWCKGMYAMSNRLLSKQRLVAALIVFLIPCPIAWQLVSSWSVGFVQSVNHELAVSARSSRQVEQWEHRPINVMAFPELHRLSVTGDIGWGSAKALAKVLENYPDIHLIELESPGGFVHEANLIVDHIQKREMDTLVRGRCMSACTELFLAGKRRFVGPDARFGFHQAGFEGRDRNTEWSISEYESSIFYRSKGVSQDFADKALNTSYYSLWKPHVLDVKLKGFATDWWSERPKEYE